MARFQRISRIPRETHADKHIHGGVTSDGKFSFGEGFRVEPVAGKEGTYMVTFTDEDNTSRDEPFADTPSVVCTVQGNTALSIRVTELNKASFTCETLNGAVVTASAFNFIAFGEVRI